MAETQGARNGLGKSETDHVAAPVTEERAHGRLASWHVHRDPGAATQLCDLNSLGTFEAARCKLATNLIDEGFALPGLAAAEVVSWRDVGRD